MLTKQLQVLIDVSLSSGRSFDDIRAILKVQGFGDEKIDTIFAEYRAKGQVSGGKQQVVATYMAPSTIPGATPTTAPVTSNVPVAPESSLSEAVTVEVATDFLPDTAEQNEQTPVSFETPVGLYTPTNETTGTVIDVDDPSTPTSSPTQQFEAPVITPNHTNTPPVMPAFMASQYTTAPVSAPPSDTLGGASSVPQTTSDVSETTPDVPPVPTPTFTTMPNTGGINVGLGGIPELEHAALEDYKRKQASSPVPLIITLIVVVAFIAASAYWFFVLGPGKPQTSSFDEFLSQRATSTEPEPFRVPLSDEDASIRAGFPAADTATSRMQERPVDRQLPPVPATTTTTGIDPFTGQPFPIE